MRMPLIFDTVLVDPTLLVAVRRLLDTKREDINRMPMLLDVSRAFAEVLINFLINEKLDALEVTFALGRTRSLHITDCFASPALICYRGVRVTCWW